MFCGECGTKNTGTSQFCENCGAKLAGAPEQQANPSPVEGNVNNVQMNNVQPTQQNQMPNTQVMATQPAKPMSKQTKLILTIIAVLAALFGGVYYYLGTLVTPEKVAEDYFNALVEVDAKKIYKFLQVEQTDFTTEKMFEKVIKNTTDKSTKMEIVNYEVGKVKYDDLSKMTAKVTITYVEKDKEKSQTVDVKLAKGKDKKWYERLTPSFVATFIFTVLFLASMDTDHYMFDENIGLWVVAPALSLPVFYIIGMWLNEKWQMNQENKRNEFNEGIDKQIRDKNAEIRKLEQSIKNKTVISHLVDVLEYCGGDTSTISNDPRISNISKIVLDIKKERELIQKLQEMKKP